MLEIEAKIKLPNRETLLSKYPLVSKAKKHVCDIYYDKKNELKKVDKVLRLRQENQTATLTAKGARIDDANLSVRKEYEVEISDFKQTKTLLELLGYSPTQIVEKTRETFALEGFDVKIELDHYPFIGLYLEIEGERDAVVSVMATLGFSMEDGITLNCTELFYNYLEKNNLELENPNLQFTFDAQTKHKSLVMTI